MTITANALTRTLATALVLVAWFSLAQPARAQAPDDCGAPTQNYLPELPAPGAASVSVAMDPRGVAPFKPAIVLNVQLPPRAAPLVARGTLAMAGPGGKAVPLSVARTEYWVFGKGPRAAVELAAADIFTPRHDSALTLYKLYVRVPAEAPERFVVSFPEFVSQQRALAIPPLAFRRIATGPELEICSVLPQ